jgi:hypothetical protein
MTGEANKAAPEVCNHPEGLGLDLAGGRTHERQHARGPTPTSHPTTVSRTYLLSEELAAWLEKLSVAMRLSESQAQPALVGWQRSGQFDAWLAENDG